MKRSLARWFLKKNTKVREGRRVRSTKPHFETTLKGITEVVDTLREKHPFFKGVWVFGSVPDKVHDDLDIIIVMDESRYNFSGNIRTQVAEMLAKRLRLKKVDFLTLDTGCMEKDLARIRRIMELWKPDIKCFYGDLETEARLKKALRATKRVKGYWAQYDKRVLKKINHERKKSHS